MSAKKEDYGKLRERLKTGKLSPDDLKKLEELISREEQSGSAKGGGLGTVGGRPIIARLPGGLDLIK